MSGIKVAKNSSSGLIGKACCGPTRESTVPLPKNASGATTLSTKNHASIDIPGGEALVGTSTPLIQGDGESPLRKKRIKPFKIAPTTVTNLQFAEFVAATGYVTEAEQFGWSFVFWSQLPETIDETRGVVGVEWWRKVEGANWKDICGPGTQENTWFPDHPVVQVSWNDAQAYARWVGGRLPSETEWEHAARGGQGDVRFPWGDLEPDDERVFPCNIWQGQFPDRNTGADGWPTTAPARSFDPNPYGLYNMTGNVWEWTNDAYKVKSLKKSVRNRLEGMQGFKLLKGGSFLCHNSYCYRYRIAARSGNSPDSTTTHQGFRVVWV